MLLKPGKSRFSRTFNRNGISLLTAWIVLPLAVTASPTVAQVDLSARVDAVFSEWDDSESPGCAVAVSRRGSLVYARGYGMADLERGIPMSPDKVFYLASVSKQFTAATAVVLAQQGRLSLDDDVRKYVPELPEYEAPITIRQLLNHTSGLRDYLTLMPLADMPLEESHAPAAILDLVARQRALNFAPGERYLYSNTGYFLIPIIVERVSGQTFREFADTHLFKPLEMSNTHFHSDHTHVVPDRAFSYARTENGFELSFLPKFDQVGSGGVLSTVEDLVHWDRNYYTGQLGGTALYDALLTRAVLNNGDTLTYALGLEIDEFMGQTTVSHSGSMMGFKTHFLRFPDRELAVICLCNLEEIDPGTLTHRVAQIYLETDLRPWLTQHQGTYESDELGVAWEISLKRDTLYVVREGRPDVALATQAGETFRLQGGASLQFARTPDGRVTGFVLDAGRAAGIEFSRR